MANNPIIGLLAALSFAKCYNTNARPMERQKYFSSNKLKKGSMAFFTMLIALLCIATKAQVANPRIPAEWEEVRAIVMEAEFYRSDSLVPWDLVFDPYIKVAQACIDEDIDLYIYQFPKGGYVGNRRDLFFAKLDTVFSNRGITSPNIHIIEVEDSLTVGFPWARDHGMYCVYKNGIDDMYMYHFSNTDKTSELADSIFNLNSIAVTGGDLYPVTHSDGGNFMTDGHGSFNIMVEDETKIVNDYRHFSRFFGIKRTVQLKLQQIHIDYYMKMLNEETIVVAYNPDENYLKPNAGAQEEIDLALAYIKKNLSSTFGRGFKMIPVQNAPEYSQGKFVNKPRSAAYTNALIINKTILVPQYACGNFLPKTDSQALEAFHKAMPGYNIIGVNCSQYQQKGGAIHCMTHEVPISEPIYIKHKWKKGKVEDSDEAYRISAVVRSSQGISDVKLYWRHTGDRKFLEINMDLQGADTYIGEIPQKSDNKEFEYYITATDSKQKSISKPFVADKGAFKYTIVNYGSIIDSSSYYDQAIFPCLPSGVAIQQATIKINGLTLTTNSLLGDTLAIASLKPGKYAYTITSPHIMGKYEDTLQVDNRYPDTIKVAINPLEFLVTDPKGYTLKGAKVTINDSLFANVPFTIHAFEGNYDYKITHPAMIDTVYRTLTITENMYGNDYLNHIQQERFVPAQLVILADDTPLEHAVFYKNMNPDAQSIAIPDDGILYFGDTKTYNYEIAGRVSVISTINIEQGQADTIALYSFIFDYKNPSCYMVISGDTLSYNFARDHKKFILKGEYSYNIFYKSPNNHIIPLDKGIVSLTNRKFAQNIYSPFYTIVSNNGKALNNATLSTGLGNNVFRENDSTFGVVHKEGGGATCTVACEGYRDTSFTPHNSNNKYRLQLTLRINTVTFVDWDGTILNIQTVECGNSAVAPKDPMRIGYTFLGWSADFTKVTGDLTVKAQYSINSYTVTFDIAANGTTEDQAVFKGLQNGDAMPKAPIVKANLGYVFKGWDVNPLPIKVMGDMTFTAQYDNITAIGTLKTKNIVIYPNPAGDLLHIKNAKYLRLNGLSITDLTGRVVYKDKDFNGKVLDIGKLKAGIYFISISGSVHRFIKR